MNEEPTIREYGDASGLIDSIRADADRKIEGLKKQALEETEKLQREYADEMRAFRDARAEETDREIEKAILILKNRAAIERRKSQLNAVEDFTRLMVNDAVSHFMETDPRGYLSFLKKKICATLNGAPGNDIVIRLSPGDAGLENELRDGIDRECSFRGAVAFVADKAITGGGAMLEDRTEGVSYNCTMDRIVSRGYDMIRNEAFAIVQRYIGPAE